MRTPTTGFELFLTMVANGCVLRLQGGEIKVSDRMHIKLSTARKLLWHYRVATPTIMLASEELPYDDNTTGGPCYA